MKHEAGTTLAPTRLAAAALHGSVSLISFSAVTRAVTFLIYVALGWILSAEDFAVYGIALGLVALAAGLNNGGIHPWLVNARARNAPGAAEAMRCALLFNSAACVLLLPIGYLASLQFDDSRIFWVVAIAAVSIPLGTLGVWINAELSATLRFHDLAKYRSAIDLARQITLIGLALLGCGAYSFVLPGLVLPILQLYFLRRFELRLPRNSHFQRKLFGEVLSSSAWVMLGAAGITIAAQGGTVVLAFLLEPQLVGIYFFGYQLVGALTTLLSFNIQSVVFPVLAIQGGHTHRQVTPHAAIRASAFLLIPLAAVAYVLAEPLVSLIWQGKWTAAVPVIQILSVGLVFRAQQPIFLAALAAQGLWKKRALLLLLDAGGGLTAIGIGASYGTLSYAAAAVLVFWAFVLALIALATRSITGVSLTTLLRANLLPLVGTVLATAASLLVIRFTVGISSVVGIILFLLLFTLLYAPFLVRPMTSATAVLRSR